MNRTTPPRVIVIGGGLAGLSAALGCADGGAAVTLLEGRGRLGGATWSFERNGLSFDNGQHVYMRCCTAYRRFLDRVGQSANAPIQERLAIPVLRAGVSGGAPTLSWIKRSGLPAPLHLGAALAVYRHLSVKDRLRLGRATLAIGKLRLSDPGLDNETFGAFLRRHGQSDAAINGLWNLITLPTVNVAADEASLALAAKVFKTGLLEESDAADLGWAHVPLSRLHGDAAEAQLRAGGANVRTRAKVTEIVTEGRDGAVSGVMVGGSLMEADAVVLAVPHEVAATLLPKGGVVVREDLEGLGRSPIIDVHVVYDRKVLDFEVAATVGSPLQYVFDTTRSSGLDPAAGQCLAVSISGADEEHGDRPAALIERYTAAIAEFFPRARNAKVLDAVVTREHAATFRGIPGTRRLRPRPDSGIGGLFLAGSWTDTGWPATMEGAVRSGVSASARALRSIDNIRGAMMQIDRDDVSEEVVA